MSIVKDTLALTAITLVAGLATWRSPGYHSRSRSHSSRRKSKQEAYKAVFEDADSFEV